MIEASNHQWEEMYNCIVIFDTEFTAWEGSMERKWSQPQEHREIIQIGAIRVSLENGFKKEAEFECIVKPYINVQLSDYIIQLTGITQKDISQEGIPFMMALDSFYHFCFQGNLPIFSWYAEIEVLQENCKINKIAFPTFPAGFYDIRNQFSELGIDHTKYESGTIYRSAGLKLNFRPHNALDDVRSILEAISALSERLTQKERLDLLFSKKSPSC